MAAKKAGTKPNKAPAKKVPAKKAPAKKKPAAQKEAAPKPDMVNPMSEVLADEGGIDPTQVLADELGLNPKQKRFCDEYLIDFNGTQAAIRAGYSENCAAVIASENLTKPNIKSYIDKRNAALSEKTGLTAELVRRQWLGILTADTNEVIQYRRNCCRYCYGKDFMYQRTAGEMKKDRARYDLAVAKALDADPKATVEPFDEEGGTGFDRTAAPNPDCPECRGEGIGDVHFMDTRHLSPGARELYAGAKIGKDGIEVKLHSKDAVREIVARHLKMFEEKAVEVNFTVASTEKLEAVYQEAMEAAERGYQEVMRRNQVDKGNPE